MRIVAGQAKGRKLSVPPGREVRPTADRVREALFSSLGARVPDSIVLDLFAGTGALGIEALSRGARHATFVEHSRKTLAILKENLEKTRCGDCARVLAGDAIRTLQTLVGESRQFDLIFLDPPYDSNLLKLSLWAIQQGTLLSPDGIIIAEHPKNSVPSLPANLQITRTKSYGDTCVATVSWQRQDKPEATSE